MKIILTLSAFIWIISVQAQTLSEEINEQVWKPFVTSYASWDADTFNSLHSDEMMRISDRKILSVEQYFTQNDQWFTYAQKEGYKQSIALRFEERIVATESAYETGYFQIQIVNPHGKKSDHYGRFHVTLKKENEVWKITQDWDSSSLNGVKVTAEDFDKLAPFDPLE